MESKSIQSIHTESFLLRWNHFLLQKWFRHCNAYEYTEYMTVAVGIACSATVRTILKPWILIPSLFIDSTEFAMKSVSA